MQCVNNESLGFIQPLNRRDKESLLQVCRMRARVAKGEAATVAAERKAEFQKQLARNYSFDTDDVWKQAHDMAVAVTAQANAEIAKRAKELGIPREFMPSLSTPWWHGRGENASAARRAELTRVANSKIDLLEKEAKLHIDRASAEIMTQIVADGLESAAARTLLESLPTVEQLMPPLVVEEIEKQLGPGLGAADRLQ